VKHVLAIDAGSTGVRAIVFGPGGASAATAYRELRAEFPRPGWVEQDPEELWRATRAVVAEALSAAGLRTADIAAIGITNQRSSIVAWDANGIAPLSPIIGWQDDRGSARAVELSAQGFYVTPLMAVTKAEWIARNLPGAAAAARAGKLRFGTPNSWLCARLTGGVHATDHSNASATGLYAYLESTWDGALLEALSIDPACMPALVDSSGVVANTVEEAIGASVPVAAMSGDQQASLFGLDCTSTGDTKCSYGTSAMVDANSGADIAVGGPGTYPLVAWSTAGETTYCVEGNVVTAGAAVQWLRDGAGIIGDAAESAAIAESVGDSGGVWAIPAFQGLGTPIGESGARAMIGGLSRGSGRAHIVRAVLEGIAQRVADAAETVWQAGSRPAALRVDGGGSSNDFLMQTQADLLGIPVERSRERDGAALGAARLAAAAVGAWNGGEAGLAWKADRTFEPAIGDDEREASRAVWKQRLQLAARELV
jgi:glycerol kinase